MIPFSFTGLDAQPDKAVISARHEMLAGCSLTRKGISNLFPLGFSKVAVTPARKVVGQGILAGTTGGKGATL
ncbi:hypothetical protein [Paracoccus sp. (in: a-proteobacteria)]|uniref:hypothetical protein n=1 Tax=Paracoccus sp. TaxID=267 RepID=UPI003A8C88B9